MYWLILLREKKIKMVIDSYKDEILTAPTEIQLNFLSLFLTAVTVNIGFGKVKI